MSSETPEKTLLSCHNLALNMGGEPVFERVSLQVIPGKVMGISGGSGTGKSLLLDILEGKLPPSDGSFSVTSSKPVRLGIPPELSRWRTVMFQLKHWIISPDMRLAIPAAIEYLQLHYYLSHRCTRLSDGWKARLMLAKLMLQPSRLWLLDHPAAMLDETGRRMLMGLAAGHLRRGGGIVAAAPEESMIRSWLPEDAPMEWLRMEDHLGDS